MEFVAVVVVAAAAGFVTGTVDVVAVDVAADVAAAVVLGIADSSGIDFVEIVVAAAAAAAGIVAVAALVESVKFEYYY